MPEIFLSNGSINGLRIQMEKVSILGQFVGRTPIDKSSTSSHRHQCVPTCPHSGVTCRSQPARKLPLTANSLKTGCRSARAGSLLNISFLRFPSLLRESENVAFGTRRMKG